MPDMAHLTHPILSKCSKYVYKSNHLYYTSIRLLPSARDML